MNRIIITLNDQKWPKITMIVNREIVGEAPHASVDSAQYDIAYTQFEGMMHNHLRLAVEKLVKKHKGER